jgi:endoglucanase
MVVQLYQPRSNIMAIHIMNRWQHFAAAVVLALGVSFVFSMNSAIAGPAGMIMQGVNISGAEWGESNIPGTVGVHYIYPTTAELDYFKAKGMNIVRVPFLWERMQPTASGPLDPNEAGRMDAVVSGATARGLYIVLDCHNYGAYRQVTVGVPGGHSNAMFADLWTRLAQRYGANPNVIFGLMNEPIGSSMTSTTWLASAQAGINAIRAVGVRNLILVPSTYWGHPVNFVELNASVMINVTDPANNYAYDVHQYLDYDGSGRHTDVLSPSDSVATLSTFTSWLRANHRTGFLSEIGVPASSEAQASLGAMLQYMHSNKDVWTGYTYWSAGPWWQNYIFGVEPVNGQDTTQMKTLIANLGSTSTTPTPTPEPTPEPTPTPTPEPTPTPTPTKKTKPPKPTKKLSTSVTRTAAPAPQRTVPKVPKLIMPTPFLR